MKGFKDKQKRFHPITESRGTRKSRDQKTKEQGVLIRKSRNDKKKKWKLYRFDGENDVLMGEFETRNDAINHVKWLDRIADVEPSKFSYYPKWKVWSDSPMMEGYQITKGELPEVG